jgi:tetratricopeptide (TPR) repeat protein
VTRRLVVVVLLGATLLGAAGPARAAAPCEPTATDTGYTGRERFRLALEEFRETLEAGRDAVEAERAARLIDLATYRARIGEYFRAIDIYREGIARYRESDCRWIDNQVLTVRMDEAQPPASDRVVVRVAYYYTGNRGPDIGLQAITLLNGESTGHWAYRPAPVGIGLNVTVIPLGMNDAAPDRYESNELLVGFFIPRGAVFSERTIPFERTWVRGKRE